MYKKFLTTCWTVILVFSGLTLSIPTASADESVFQLTATPVLRRGSGASFDGTFIDPGAMVHHGGKFHMLYAALPYWPHPIQIGYAVSDDGVNWERPLSEPVVKAFDTGLGTKSILPTSALVADDGQWVLYFTAVYPGKQFTGAILRATASSPVGPWKTDPAPVLEPGAPGTWDGIAIGQASVVVVGGEYHMYYTGIGKYQVGNFVEEHEYIGLAKSNDGKNWIKHEGPVFVASKDENAWDSWSFSDTNVQKTDEGWVMVYRGTSFSSSGQVGMAVSADGIKWERMSDEPIVSQATVGKTITLVSYLHHNQEDLVYIEVGTIDGTDIVLARRKTN